MTIMLNDTLEQRTQAVKQSDVDDALEQRIQKATQALLAQQRPDGHWVFELEADATIPAEYVLLRHYLGEPVDAALEAKIAVYLRRIQGAHGGWPLFRDGDLDISATVKAIRSTLITCAARAKRFSPAAAPSAPTYFRASCWLCSTSFRGAPCR
jgi:hypothetical protein